MCQGRRVLGVEVKLSVGVVGGVGGGLPCQGRVGRYDEARLKRGADGCQSSCVVRVVQQQHVSGLLAGPLSFLFMLTV